MQSGQGITGKAGMLTPLIKQLIESALSAKLDSHLVNDIVPSRKNGKSKKTLKTSSGKIGLNMPRDRAGTFESQLIKKHMCVACKVRLRATYSRCMAEG